MSIPVTPWWEVLKLREEIAHSSGSIDDVQMSLFRAVHGTVKVASGIRCKSAGVVPGFMIRLGDGTDSFRVVCGLAGGDGARPELAGRFEQGAAQILQQPQSV